MIFQAKPIGPRVRISFVATAPGCTTLAVICVSANRPARTNVVIICASFA